MKYALSFFISILFVSCMVQPTILKDEQNRFLNVVMNEPLTFTVPADSIEVVWSRAINFLSNYSDMKIQTVTDYYIDTYNPSYNGFVNYGYKVNKIKVNQGYQIVVDGTCNFPEGSWIQENLHIASLYIRTGNMPYPELIEKGSHFNRRNIMQENYRKTN